MSTYNNNRFTPGRKGNLRAFINRSYIRQYYRAFLTNQTFDNINNGDDITTSSICGCIQDKVLKGQQSLNDNLQPENRRIAQLLSSSLGGKTTFGNSNKPATINYLGGWQGQPGGTRLPPRNRF
jgi:hypothetical protein